MNVENTLGSICHIVDAIGHISDVSMLDDLIKKGLKKIIKYDQMVYILARKQDLRVVKVLNWDHAEFVAIVDDKNRIKKDVFHGWLTCNKYNPFCVASYGLQDSEREYASFFLCFDSDVKCKIESDKILELLLPRLHSSFVKLYRSEILHSTNIKSLSPREKEILLWISKGKTNSEIGMILGISAYTVKNHVSNILEKLSVSNRAEAVNKAMMYVM